MSLQPIGPIASRIVTDLMIKRRVKSEKLARTLRLCESPIESMMIAAIHEIAPAVNLPVHIIDGPLLPTLEQLDRGEHPWKDGIYLFIQAQLGQDRVDACVWVWDAHEAKKFVIECDGFQHHLKHTLQQVKDRQRDRRLAALGYTVLRFTGWEITGSPTKGAREFFKIIGHPAS